MADVEETSGEGSMDDSPGNGAPAIGADSADADAGVPSPRAAAVDEGRAAGDQEMGTEEQQDVALHGHGPTAIATRLQCALLTAALAELGLRGPAVPLSVWCQALGRFGVSSTHARELFEILDMDQAGRVAPSAFSDADLSREALVEVLTSSLDLVYFLQLRYRLLLFGCHTRLGLSAVDTVCAASFVDVCRQLHLLINEVDARAFIRGICEKGGGGCIPTSAGVLALASGGSSQIADAMLPISLLCHQLAIWSISAAKLSSCALAPEKVGPLQELGSEDGGPVPPRAYVGRTPVEIIVLFKDPATFPWYRLPEVVCGRRFEELWQLANVERHHVAEEAVRLLTDPAFDRPAG